LKVRKDFGKNQEKLFYEFGPFRLDVRERMLERHGEEVPLTPKVFDILLVLVQNRGRILTKDEMMSLVWPDTMVEESNLTRNISTLRKALGDGPNEHRYIETIPWRGYRFVASVREMSDQSATIDSLAVLPFLNESADPAAEYLSDGVTESLINKLSLLTGLKVMSRNSVFRYKVRDPERSLPNAETVGRELGVRAVLTGRIRQTERILIASVELVDAADNRHIWGAQYNREFSDIFAMQEAMAQQIAERLRLRLTGKDRDRLTRRHTENPDSYQLYLRGRYFWNKLTIDGVRRGIEHFQQAIEKDPGYAAAYAGLLDCYTYLNSPAEARRAAIKALELDPALGEAHASLGFFKFLYDWDWPEAEREFMRAIELNPNYPEAHHWYAIYLANMGRHREAIREAKHARELDPLSLLMNQTAGNVLCLARDYDRAIEELQKTLDMDANFASAHGTLGLVYAQKGMCEEAIAEFQKVNALVGGIASIEASVKALMGYAYARSGDKSQAIKLIDEISDPSQQVAPPYSIAGIYAALGETDQAFEWLNKAYQDRSFQLVGLKVDPTLDNLRSDPRFQDLLDRVGLAP
jgi:adenylate cyclase